MLRSARNPDWTFHELEPKPNKEIKPDGALPKQKAVAQPASICDEAAL
jgi:hypothetical protein